MKLRFIINAQACRLPAATITSLIREKSAGNACRIDFTEYPGHARQLAEQACRLGYDALIAVGGDGTVHEVVNGSRGNNIPIGIIPAGTANDLAERLGIPGEFEEACDIILSHTIRHIAVMKVNGYYFLTTCGIGFPAEVIAAVRDIFNGTGFVKFIRRYLRYRIYAIGVLFALLKKLPHTTVRICADGKWFETSLMSLIIGLQPGLGKYFTPLPHADPGSAAMAAYSIQAGGRLRMLWHVFKTIRGEQRDLPDTHFMRARSIILELRSAMPFFGDGELLAADSRFEIACLPEAIPVFVPQTAGNQL